MKFWDLFQWWNLIFTLPFSVGMLPLLLQAMGAARLSRVGHEVYLAGHHLPDSGGGDLSHLGNDHATIHGHVSADVASGHSTSLSTTNTHPVRTLTATDTQSAYEPGTARWLRHTRSGKHRSSKARRKAPDCVDRLIGMYLAYLLVTVLVL
jgi:hypothetical protein